MAEQWSLMVVLLAVFVMATVTTATGARPVSTGDRTDAAKVAAICSSNHLVCAESTLQTATSRAAGVQSDHSTSTINDLQRDFILESALVVGGTMTLDANLRDDAPKRAFLTASSATQLQSFLKIREQLFVSLTGLTDLTSTIANVPALIL